MSKEKPSESVDKLSGPVLAVRCHDITVSLDNKQSADFDQLIVLGMAVRLALHLRGVPAVPYELLKQVALHIFHIPPQTLRQVVGLLAEIEFIKVDQEGDTIRSIVPNIPYYEDLFVGVGEFAETSQLSEPEWLTLSIVDRLSRSPTPRETLYNVGAETKLVNRMVELGSDGGYLIQKRARGRDMVVSPLYFYENPDRFADLAAGAGSSNVSKVVSALSHNQGWPLALTQKLSRIGETDLTPEQVQIVAALAGEGFAPPPAIKTTHAGSNFFLFAPKPGIPRLSPMQRPVYEAAMALVAAIRQGQLLPAQYAIRSPLAVLSALKDRKFLKANTEAMEQYRQLVVLRIGRLVKTSGSWARFELIDTPDNLQAIEMAITLVSGEEPAPVVREDIVLAFKKGESYLEPLIGRQLLKAQEKVTLDAQSLEEIENLLLKGAP